jgi:hypothetical protein
MQICRLDNSRRQRMHVGSTLDFSTHVTGLWEMACSMPAEPTRRRGACRNWPRRFQVGSSPEFQRAGGGRDGEVPGASRWGQAVGCETEEGLRAWGSTERGKWAAHAHRSSWRRRLQKQWHRTTQLAYGLAETCGYGQAMASTTTTKIVEDRLMNVLTGGLTREPSRERPDGVAAGARLLAEVKSS